MDDAIRRIRKTITLAQDQGNSFEGESAWRKVHELLNRHGLTLEEVYSGQRRNKHVGGRSTRLLPGWALPSKKKTTTIPWGEFFRVERDEMVTLQIVPDRSVQSGRAVESILNTFHSMHETIFDRVWNEGMTVVFKTQDFASYRIVYEKGSIKFYLVVPKSYTSTILHAVENVWPKAAIHPVENPVSDLNAEKTLCAFLELKDHFFKATLVDRNRSNPIPSLMSAGRNVLDNDKAVLDVAFIPVGEGWKSRAEAARAKYLKGVDAKKLPSKWTDIFLVVGDLVGAVIEKAFGLFDLAFGAEPEKEEKPTRKVGQLKPWTNTKTSSPGFSTVIRIASQSENKQRADLTLRSIGTAFKDLSSDNEFEMKRVSKSKPFVEQLKKDRVPTVSINSNILSIPEASQIFQMPSAAIQDEYPEIKNIPKVEVEVSGELFQEDIPGVTLGEVTEKGVTRTAKIPLAPYTIKVDGRDKEITQNDVYDAFCTVVMVDGKVGVGKTASAGGNHVIDSVKAGLTTFFLDTADGQIAKEIANALPKDYPEEKLIFLDYRNTKRPVPLSYADIADTAKGRGDDAELAELEMTTKLTSHIQEFVNAQSSTGELTDRMRQYFNSVALATKGRPMHIKLALQSPAYREELLADPLVQAQPDIVRDLMALQEKAASGSIDSVVGPILARLQMLERTPLLANIFLSEDKRDENGELLINFRKFADNAEGGYGYCVIIVCPEETYGPEGQELICSTIQSKIFLTAYSRIDQDQSQRKPFVSIADEPHRFIKGGAAKRLYSNAAVVLRKYRCRAMLLAHTPNQLGEVWDAFSSGGSQLIVYKTEKVSDYRLLENQLAPYDANYVYANLPDKFEAVCRLRLPSGQESPAFFCKMAKPPNFVKDRSKRLTECGELFGHHWKEALATINETRQQYQLMDEEWYQRIAEEKAEQRAAKKRKNDPDPESGGGEPESKPRSTRRAEKNSGLKMEMPVGDELKHLIH